MALLDAALWLTLLEVAELLADEVAELVALEAVLPPSLVLDLALATGVVLLDAALWLALLEVAELLADEVAVLVALEAALPPSLALLVEVID